MTLLVKFNKFVSQFINDTCIQEHSYGMLTILILQSYVILKYFAHMFDYITLSKCILLSQSNTNVTNL